MLEYIIYTQYIYIYSRPDKRNIFRDPSFHRRSLTDSRLHSPAHPDTRPPPITTPHDIRHIGPTRRTRRLYELFCARRFHCFQTTAASDCILEPFHMARASAHTYTHTHARTPTHTHTRTHRAASVFARTDTVRREYIYTCTA